MHVAPAQETVQFETCDCEVFIIEHLFLLDTLTLTTWEIMVFSSWIYGIVIVIVAHQLELFQ